MFRGDIRAMTERFTGIIQIIESPPYKALISDDAQGQQAKQRQQQKRP